MMAFLSHCASLFPRRGQLKAKKAAKQLPNTIDRAPRRSPLHSVLRAARISAPGPNDSYFIPANAFDRCLTKDTIKAEMVRLGIDTSLPLEELADYVYKKSRKIFAILTMINKGDQIEKLLAHHPSDADLPLRMPESAEYRRPLLPEFAGFESWSDRDIHSFSSTQWSFLAPFFSRGTSSAPHYELERQTILPFVEDKDLSAPRSGGFSTVYDVQIHPAHHSFDLRHGNNAHFALKELRFSKASDFEQEVSNLRMFSHKYAHDHLINLLASYSQGSKKYFLFPWAEKDLRRYWEDSVQPPELTIQMVEWSLRQMRGLACALDAIHNYPIQVEGQVESTSGLATSTKAPSDVVCGWHADIKPENILWFSNPSAMDSPDDKGVLKIADFGLAKFHTSLSPRVDTTTACGTLTYEPPDRWLGSEISQPYDIWSLGCVFSEFITWMLMGSEGGELFRDARIEPGSVIDPFNGVSTDNFFTIDGGMSGVPKSARLKDGVRLWMADLRGHPKCSYALRDLLIVIESELLVPEAQKRATSGTLIKLLDQIIQKGAASEQYRVADTAIQLRPPQTSKKRDFQPTNLKTWSPSMKRARLDLIQRHWSLPLSNSPHEDEDRDEDSNKLSSEIAPG
jgi:serine/threonine protein kinase